MSGFTLPELLVAVALFILLAAVGIPSFNHYTRRQVLIQAAEDFKSDLRRAQAYAANGRRVSDSDTNAACWGILSGVVGEDVCSASYCLASYGSGACDVYEENKAIYFRNDQIAISSGQVIFNRISGLPQSPAEFTLTFQDMSVTVGVDSGGGVFASDL